LPSEGCVYVSGQFNERVEPLGEEPVVTLTLWLPARCITEASVKSRAAGRMWLKSLQVALESPFFGAALAGCRWECAFFTTSPYEAGELEDPLFFLEFWSTLGYTTVINSVFRLYPHFLLMHRHLRC
jgi:hypothetical protein